MRPWVDEKMRSSASKLGWNGLVGLALVLASTGLANAGPLKEAGVDKVPAPFASGCRMEPAKTTCSTYNDTASAVDGQIDQLLGECGGTPDAGTLQCIVDGLHATADKTVCTAAGDPAGTLPACASGGLGPVVQALEDLAGQLSGAVPLLPPTAAFVPAANSTAPPGNLTLGGTFQRAEPFQTAYTTLSTLKAPAPLLALFDVTGTIHVAKGGSSVGDLTPSFNQSAGTFEATLVGATAGSYRFDLTVGYVSLPLGEGHATKTIVVNQAPIVSAGADQQALTGGSVTLTGTASDPDGDALTLQWSQLTGPAVTLSSASTATTTFTAPQVSSVTSLQFRFQATDPMGLSASATTTVTVRVHRVIVNITNSSTTMAINATSFVAPTAGTASTTGLDVSLHDLNGLRDISNGLLTANVTGPERLDAVVTFVSATDSNPEGDANTLRTYHYTLTFPARMKEGAYQFAASYDNSLPVTHPFDVANVAPTIAVPTAGSLLAQSGHGAIVSDAVPLTLNDLNWGGFAGSTVTELKSLTLAGVPSGFTPQVSADHGGNWTNVTGPSGYNLTNVSNGLAGLDLEIRFVSDAGVVPAGTYTITATVTDQAGGSSTATLMGMLIRPQNYGFLMSVFDGGHGILIGGGSVAPGAHYDSSGSLVRVDFTGTFNADNLTVSLTDFACGCGGSFSPYNADPAKNGHVKFYQNPDLTGTPLDVALTPQGTAFFDVTSGAFGVAGSLLYVVLDVYVPAGSPAGSYTGYVDVTGTGHAQGP